MTEHYDILICGAGMVGTSLALSLSSSPLRIAVCEANPLVTETEQNSKEGRSLALTISSVEILEKIGIWPAVAEFATPINTVHVSARRHFGTTSIHAREENIPALGYVIPAVVLGVEFNKALLKKSPPPPFFKGGIQSESIVPPFEKGGIGGISLFNPIKVEKLTKTADGWDVMLSNAQKIQTRLIVAADGTHSTIRKLLNIPTLEKDYHQSAISTRIMLKRPHNYIAYERFIDEGAIALLPLAENDCGLIVTGATEKINHLMTLADNEFLTAVQQQFGYRAGKFLQVAKRYVYPLKMLVAEEQVKPGLVLIGNAARTLHPIAAQGFNLGLTDVSALNDAIKNKQDFKNNQKNIIQFTDSLTRIFSHDFFPLKLARSSGLVVLNLFSPLKHRLARRLMGKTR